MPIKKINNKVAFTFFTLGIIEIGLIFRPITVSIPISREYIAIFEFISVPITVFILTLYIIQYLNWKWTSQKTFSIGYWCAFVITLLFLITDYLPTDTLLATSLKPFYPLFEALTTLLLPPIRYILFFFGWSTWNTYFISLYLFAVAIWPLFVGMIATFTHFGLNIIKQKN